MVINDNISSLIAYNSLNAVNNKLQKSINSLSTGLRINHSSDDAAGFAISEKIRSQASGLAIAMRNSQDGVSMLQTAEGALGDINSMLQRMRELAVQASNDTLTSQDRNYIQLEIDELKGSIDRMSEQTQFNRKRLLNGSAGAVWAAGDLGVKANINGGLTHVDEFGQKVSSQGNYRLEVRAEPGQAQVQKSNIYNLADSVIEKTYKTEYETVTETVTEEITEISTEIIYEDQTLPYSIYINDGVDTLNAASGEGWNFRNGVLNITADGTYNIIGNKDTTNRRINIAAGVNATIFMTDVNIESHFHSLSLSHTSTINIYLKGHNTLKSQQGGAIHMMASNEGQPSITISSASGDGSTDGILEAISGGNSAGIGSWAGYRSGNITINGGTITAVGGEGAPGIGEHCPYPSYYDNIGNSTSNITINGGNVTALAGDSIYRGYGAGSGTGDNYNPYINGSTEQANTNITITGGTVNAIGHYVNNSLYGADIGGD